MTSPSEMAVGLWSLYGGLFINFWMFVLNYFPKRPSGASLHTLSNLCDVPVGFVPHYLEAVYYFICGRRRVAVARYRLICLVLLIARWYGNWGGLALKPQVNQTDWMTVVAPADRPKSVRNICVIERICSVFVSFYLCVVCRSGVFVIRLR